MYSRAKKTKQFPVTVLVVCEGQNTEPAYFKSLEKYLNHAYHSHYQSGISFRIFPFPPEERTIENQDNQLFGRVRKAIPIHNPDKQINNDIEDCYQAAPLRWVRYAQKQSFDAGFDYVWSVFDYDNRRKNLIEQAFNLAQNPIVAGEAIVKIGYSSYSFEFWALLHYELFTKNLEYSECKDSGRNSLSCGTNKNNDDCNGSRCLIGYLVKQGYKVGEIIKSKNSSFPMLEPNMKKACFRAEYVRNMHDRALNYWEMMPVTTVDKLLNQVVPSLPVCKWHIGVIEFNNWSIKCEIDNDNLIVCIETIGLETLVLSPGDIRVFDYEFNEYCINERINQTDANRIIVANLNLRSLPIDVCYIGVLVNQVFHFSEL